MRPVGYYVHHQGAGHWQRGCAVASRLGRPCRLIGTVDAAVDSAPVPILQLPDDRRDGGFAGVDAEPNRPLALHYAPLGHPGVRDRMAAIARWIAEADPALLVVDVSVEVALLARLLAVPTIVVRLAGDRTDPAHLEAFRSAEALVAPFPETLEAPGTPDWVRAKTLYAGLLSPLRAPVSVPVEDGRIVVVLGRGGARLSVSDVAAAAAAVPDRPWHVLGEVDLASPTALPPNLHLHGWVADPGAHVASAAIVVGAAGDGVLGLVASAGKRFVCLPEARPFDEQVVKARALVRCHAAVVRERWPADWAAVVAKAASLNPAAIAALVRPNGLGWLVGRIEAIADRFDARRSERPIVG